jgi:hypothetical protein
MPNHRLVAGFRSFRRLCPKVCPSDHRDRNGELIVDSGLNAKAAVVQTDVIENSRYEKNSQDSQVLADRYTYRLAVRWPSGRRRRFAKPLEGL